MTPKGTSCLLALLVVALPGFAQEGDRFGAIHDRLTAAADEMLAVTRTNPAPEGPSAGTESLEQVASLPVASAGGRVAGLRPLVTPILREEMLPEELLGVVLVESGGDPRALSRRGALGIWQLMPETARRFGLTVEPGRDDRLDPLLSTRAAARYLRFLFDRYQDWELVFAAYNAGEARVDRAIAAAGRTEFAALRLPTETRRYVPAVKRAVGQLRPRQLKNAALIPASFGEQGE